ncbi:MAG: tyrosine-protein kinase domain-containing protein [Chloroflexota bacterium]
MELRQYAALVWRWLWLLVLAAVLAGGAAYYVSSQMTPIYRASTTLLVSQAQNPGTPDYNSLLTGERLARTYGQLLEKRPVLETTIASLALPLSPQKLAEIVEVRVVRDTQLIELSVDHPNPDLAARIANTLAAAFIAQVREDSLGETAAYQQSLRVQLADVEQAIKDANKRLDDLRNARAPQADLAVLQGAVTQYQSTYTQILKADQDMKLAEAKAVNQVKVAEPAEPPTIAVSPKVLQNTLLAALVGLMLAAGAAFLFEYLDDTVKSAADVERLGDLPTLGNIVRFPRNGHPERLVSERDPKSPVAEAYRVLRTNVDFARVSHPGSTLLVTSSLAGEGKSTTAANLAVINAIAGRSVILVDADLRRPSAHKFFGLDNAAGLTNLLLRQGLPLETALQATSIAGLRLMASGPIPPNPAELLASPRMAALVEALQATADLIIFDSPPLLAVSDPVILGAQLEGLALVVDAGRTRAGALARALDVLQHGQVPVLGVVLNKIHQRDAGGYYYYRYYGDKKHDPQTPALGAEN